MRLINPVVSLTLFAFLGCELSEGVFENPLDREVASAKGIEGPALVFYPDKVTTSTGSSAAVSVYAMDIVDVGMAEITINYDPNKILVSSVSKGDLFQGGNPPFFLYEDDDNQGQLIIYITYLGPDSDSVSGTGNIANIIFNTLSQGQSEISISSSSIILDPDAQAITLNGYGKGTIDAQ